ncbi:restriction endonuclease [Paenibacillus sp. FSL W7-1279]|uniref:restriction endonuclease n=1 Tax=Paenibacillus sp. FSL W7-1279 TaxID=2921697 RepID=UPI0030D6E232
MINWKKINARYFEKFIYHMLGFEGFRNIDWYGRGGGDQGRDVTCTTYEELPFGLGYERKWVFQCKKWSRMPSQGDIYNECAKAKIHNPDFWVMAIPVDASANMIDYFKNLGESFGFKVVLIPLVKLEEMLYKYPDLLQVLETGELPNVGGVNEYAKSGI